MKFKSSPRALLLCVLDATDQYYMFCSDGQSINNHRKGSSYYVKISQRKESSSRERRCNDCDGHGRIKLVTSKTMYWSELSFIATKIMKCRYH